MVNKCFLCLEHPTIPGPKFLDIFSEEGIRLEISSIINKHFWLKTYRNGGDSQRVCMTCWEVVRDFHILYNRVEEAHRVLQMKTIVIDDPLPHHDVVMLKSEANSVPMLQDPIMENACLSDNPFDSEVKVEVNDLDFLPQIEIIETATDLPSSSRAQRRSRLPGSDHSPKTSQTKRIKNEPVPVTDDDDDNNDNDFDVFAENDVSADEMVDAEQLNKSFLSSALDVTMADDELNEINKVPEVKETKAKRGRPRKSEAEKAAAKAASLLARKRLSKKALKRAAGIKNVKDEAEAEEPSCSKAPKPDDTPRIKTEQMTDEALAKLAQESADVSATALNADQTELNAEAFSINRTMADDDDENDNDNDNDYAVKDSEDSENSDSNSGDNSDASDWAPEQQGGKNEKYAVIVKRERKTPKKYKKREKSVAEPKRMSKEDIAARQAQQAEHDDIITKFFEKIRCPKCELLVHTFGDMRAHFRLDHNDDHGFVECCGRRFATRKSLAEHIMVHYNPEHFKCKTCEKVCRDSTQLEIHEQTHLPNPPEGKSKKTFQCEKCSKTFSSKASFEHHMVAKHVPREEFKFECPECKKKCPTDRKLKDHMKSVHDPHRSVICDKCGKTLKSGYSLKKHHDIEHSDMPKPVPIPQQCEICGAWLRHLAGLKQHMKNIHESEQTEHRCHICSKVSSTSRALKRHIYHNHECAKKFQCTMCDKAFKRAQDLREHTSVHTGEVLYTCPNCPMTFFSNANMYKHRQRLHRAEWEADRSKPIPPNIMKQAKQGSRVIKVKRNMEEDIKPLIVPPMPMPIPMPMAMMPTLNHVAAATAAAAAGASSSSTGTHSPPPQLPHAHLGSHLNIPYSMALH